MEPAGGRSRFRRAWTTTRRTAVFLCDVENGVTDAIGQLEAESPEAGGLLREVRAQAGGPGVEGVPDLALGLLAGSFMLNAGSTPAAGGGMARADPGPGLPASTVAGACWRLGCQADEQRRVADLAQGKSSTPAPPGWTARR